MVQPKLGSPNLFKYLMRDDAEALLSTGALRIATLFEFQDVERYGPEIGEESEGVRTVYSDEDFDIEHVPEFARGTLIHNPEGHKNIRFQGIQFSLDRRSPNLYIYSTCAVFERELLSQLGRDVCVEILDTYLFFSAVTRHLNTAGIATELLYLGPCVYRPRREHHSVETSCHPAILKAPEYSHQREVRAVWQPSGPDVNPVVVVVPELTKTVRLVSIP